jgi:ubiquinol-cytochrome c reductase cytochrome b subunit
MSRFLDWVDDRTGCRRVARALMDESLPGGPRWRYVWGHALGFMFIVQIVTGLALWTAYSPSRTTAWESVYHIQYHMLGGWLVRGVHHFASHVTVVLLTIHFLQVIVYRAYRAPREVNYWIGLVMTLCVLGMALTGYWLPADQRALASIQVTTGLVQAIPWVGEPLARVMLGGAEFGHHTLTRAFALHAGALPAALGVLLLIHYAIFRGQGRKTPPLSNAMLDSAERYWPRQWLRNIAVCVTAAGIAMGLVFASESPDGTGGTVWGAQLGAPADEAADLAAERPELYFLFFNQLLKYLAPYPLFVGALVAVAVLLVLLMMPFWGRWRVGHAFNVLLAIGLIGGAAILTALGIYDDYHGAAAQQFLAARSAASERAERALELAASPQGIPPAGMRELMASDPLLQGPPLFRRHCAACHSHYDALAEDAGELDQDPSRIVAAQPTASNLWRFGSREWVAGILDPERIAGPQYFGNTSHVEMVSWVTVNIGEKVAELEGEELATFRRHVEDVTYALSAEAELPYQSPENGDDVADRIAAGREAMVSVFECTGCHKFHDNGELGLAPDLTGYASAEWLRGMISDPTHERFYRDTNDRMPAFLPAGEEARAARLTPHELEMIDRWLRREWHVPGDQ